MSVRGVILWAVASNERAILNARAAATQCSRARVERAEVERFLADHAPSIAPSIPQVTAKAAAGGR